ncbi:MAG: aminotransferase class III-fold pyridoxal phosphate-dependent enzyme [Bryobacterales bacterium]
MDAQQMIELCKKHTMYSWSATGSVNPLPVARAEGVYFYAPDGRRWLDFNSQLMSVNIGHGHPKVIEAIRKQAETLCFAFPGSATEVRARLGQKLAELCPGDIDVFFFTLGGAEANEQAIRAARLYTGRHKILARYRSYHGGTNATLMLTGDPRRLANEPGMPGVVHVMDPEPYTYSFGKTPEEIVRNNLTYLEEVIRYEGPQQIAAMFVESVTGTNGVLPPPPGYLKGLRALLDKYGILLVCDEVMAGFGRTGKLFAFMHDDVLPDIVTMAKGLTSSYLPLGAMGVRQPIADHFQKNVFWGGLTYNSHPMGLAAAIAAIDVLVGEGLIENAARLQPVMHEQMAALKRKHPAIVAHRNRGLFGILDTSLGGYNEGHPALAAFHKHLIDHGLFTMLHWGSIMTNPPLCITEEQLQEGFAILDSGMHLLDDAAQAASEAQR